MMRTLALLIATALLAGVTSAEAIHWTGNGDGSSWEDGANWDLNHQPTGVDDVYMDSGTADVTTSDAVLNRFQSGGTVNINSGGVLTGSNGYTLRYITLINVNNGGSLPASAGWDVRSHVSVNTGGVFTGTDNIRDSKTLTVAGTWYPIGESPSTLVFTFGASTVSGHVNLTSGNIVMDLFGDGVNEYFNVNRALGSCSLSLDGDEGGTVTLRPLDGYTPQVGDSYDLWDYVDGNTVTPGDGTNISLPGYTLDLSQWVSDGIVTVIPEPATMGLLAAGAVALLRRRRV